MKTLDFLAVIGIFTLVRWGCKVAMAAHDLINESITSDKEKGKS